MSASRTTRSALRRSLLEAETRLAAEAAQRLAPLVGDAPEDEPARIVVHVRGRRAGETLDVPLAALKLFYLLLDEMSQRKAVTLTPVRAELTTQESADLLNVSRPFLIKLLDAGEITYRRVGRNRRVRLDDLMSYKQLTDAARAVALDELAAQAQELGMGY